VSPHEAESLDLVRRHNGLGWFWANSKMSGDSKSLSSINVPVTLAMYHAERARLAQFSSDTIANRLMHGVAITSVEES
jgi:hypothetical protein